LHVGLPLKRRFFSPLAFSSSYYPPTIPLPSAQLDFPPTDPKAQNTSPSYQILLYLPPASHWQCRLDEPVQ